MEQMETRPYQQSGVWLKVLFSPATVRYVDKVCIDCRIDDILHLDGIMANWDTANNGLR
jgi:hypothetical protein